MIDLKRIVRSNILDLKPYSSARDEYKKDNGIFLDANESPFGRYNRYPDPYQRAIKAKLSEYKGIDPEYIFFGNGSDEIIDLAFRIFCTPKLDQALIFTPTYGMYEVTASINQIELLELPLNETFQIEQEDLFPYLLDERVKLIFICSPNNPTGNTIDIDVIESILQQSNQMVFVDEAYIDYAESCSALNLIEKYNNLIICQTFSKAWGLAGARVGVGYAQPEVVQLFNKVKPPYNLGSINQELVIQAIDQRLQIQKQIDLILKEKQRVYTALLNTDLVEKVYPSETNFLLFQVADAHTTYQKLIDQHLVIRNRHKQIANCLRVSIGTPEENDRFINALNSLK